MTEKLMRQLLELPEPDGDRDAMLIGGQSALESRHFKAIALGLYVYGFPLMSRAAAAADEQNRGHSSRFHRTCPKWARNSRRQAFMPDHAHFSGPNRRADRL